MSLITKIVETSFPVLLYTPSTLPKIFICIVEYYFTYSCFVIVYVVVLKWGQSLFGTYQEICKYIFSSKRFISFYIIFKNQAFIKFYCSDSVDSVSDRMGSQTLITSEGYKLEFEEPKDVDQKLVDCKNCGRHFAANRIETHELICQNQKKRKPFDITLQRIRGTDAEKYLSKNKNRAKLEVSLRGCDPAVLDFYSINY